MKRRAAIFHLQEIAVDIPGVISDIEAGRYDENGDLAFEVALGHLLDHLALAWHQSRMTDEQLDTLSQAEYERLCTSIPKLQIDNRLVETYEKVV